MRRYDDIFNLMYSVAHRIKLDSESVDDMVHDAWMAGRLHTCEDHELTRTITNDMLNARKARSGCVGSQKLTAASETVSLSDITDASLNALTYTDPNHHEDQECADFFLNSLDFTEQMVVRCCIYRGQTLRKIASDWGVVHSVVSDVYYKAINKMRESRLARELR